MLEIKETKQTEEILPQDSMKAAIDKLVKKEELSPQLTKTIMHQIMSGQASPVQIASYLTAMRMKGETAGEISASAEVMRDFSKKVQTKKHVLMIRCRFINWTMLNFCKVWRDAKLMLQQPGSNLFARLFIWVSPL